MRPLVIHPFVSDGDFVVASLPEFATMNEDALDVKRKFVGQDVFYVWGLAMISFGRDQAIRSYNQALLDLFFCDQSWINHVNYMSDFLDDLRARRLLPEMADFGAYRAKWTAMLESEGPPYREDWHLVDERTLRCMAMRLPEEGMIWTFQDVTAEMQMKRRCNELLQRQQTIQNHLHEAIIIVGIDLRIEYINESCELLLNIEDKSLDFEKFFQILGAEDPKILDDVARAMAERSVCEKILDRPRSVHFRYAPLSDGSHAFFLCERRCHAAFEGILIVDLARRVEYMSDIFSQWLWDCHQQISLHALWRFVGTVCFRQIIQAATAQQEITLPGLYKGFSLRYIPWAQGHMLVLTEAK